MPYMLAPRADARLARFRAALATTYVQYMLIYTECPRRNVPEFGRVFLMLKYTDITQNTYVQI